MLEIWKRTKVCRPRDFFTTRDTLIQENEFNKSARDEIETGKIRITHLEEQLAQKATHLESLRQDKQQTKQELVRLRQEFASLQRASLNAVGLEKKLRDANNRIESLTAQVKEQVVSLKNAHQTINFLRAQKASRSYSVPGLDGPGHEVVTPPEPPKRIP